MDQHEHESEERGLPLEHVVSDTSDRSVALIVLGAAAALIALLVAIAVGVSDAPLVLLIIWGVAAVAALSVAWFKARVWAGWSNPQLFLPSSDPLHLGDHVVVRFRRTARGRSGINGLAITALVRVEERVSYQQGKNRQTVTEVVYEAPLEILMNDSVNRTIEADIGIDIPLYEAPPSMDLDNNDVHWELIVNMTAPNAPDDLSSFTLDVDPQVASRLQSGGSGR
jgi:hypothetical protein